MLASGAYCLYRLYEPIIVDYYKTQYSVGIKQEEYYTGPIIEIYIDRILTIFCYVDEYI